MSDLKLPGDRPPIPTGRVIIWIIVGGIGVYFLGSGLIGILTPGN